MDLHGPPGNRQPPPWTIRPSLCEDVVMDLPSTVKCDPLEPWNESAGLASGGGDRTGRLSHFGNQW